MAFAFAFSLAFFGLAIGVAPLWMISRTAQDLSRSVVRFGIALSVTFILLTIVALVVPPLYARAFVLVSVWLIAVKRLYAEGFAQLDIPAGTVLMLVALFSALLPDTTYVPWDNYTHWSVITKSFDYGAPVIGNEFTKFPTYPPMQPLILFYLSGIFSFTTDNLQTHKILLLAYLSALMLVGAEGPSTVGRLHKAARWAVFPLLLAMTYRITGNLQSGYADFTAAAMLAVGIVATYQNIAKASNEKFALAVVALTTVPLLRIGMLAPAMLLSVLLVGTDYMGRIRERSAITRGDLVVYAGAVLAPLTLYFVYYVSFLSFYGDFQNKPSHLLASAVSLASGARAEFVDAVIDKTFIEGVPQFRGFGVSIGMMVVLGLALGLCGACLGGPYRRPLFLYVLGITAIMVMWIVAIVLQMVGFFAADPDLPSYERYVGILLFPFLIGMVLTLLHPAGRLAAWVSFVVFVGGAVAAHAALLPTAFWRPVQSDVNVASISRNVRSLVGTDRVWILTSNGIAGHFNNFAFHYYLMPARTNGNVCFTGNTDNCPTVDSRVFALHLLTSGYRWVLVDQVGSEASRLLEPIVADPTYLAQRKGETALFRVVVDPQRPGHVVLVGVLNPSLGMAADDIAPLGITR
jgi:hypothetical protein